MADMIIGNHLWRKCFACGKLVKMTGLTRGLHICTPSKDR